METKTILAKGNHFVEVVSCVKIINNKIMHWHISGTDKYYIREATAIKAANELLIEKSLSESDFKERKQMKIKIRNASKVVNIYDCMKATEAYIERWDGVLYLETKKNLCEELRNKLKSICAKFGFETPHEAVRLVRDNYVKTFKR
jgi:hypothetical protein